MHSENKTLLVIILFITLNITLSIKINEQDVNSIQDNGYQEIYKDNDGLRSRLMDKKIEYQKSQMLDHLTNNTVYVDGIPHYDVHTAEEKERINKMETGFLSMLSMKGVKYIFKRGFHWRTWRDIENEGNKTIICYKCKGVGNTSCKNCLTSGYWVMEEKPPPCPYEILSVTNNNQICSIYFAQWNDVSSTCPTLINLNDLLSVCDNPLETEWKITSKYNDLESETTLADICKGRESCRILTLYTILPHSILFRIINRTNHIIYSRVMMNGHRNYACVDNCGIIDRKTNRIIKNDSPLIFDLLSTNSDTHKNKRENKINNTESTTDPALRSLFFLSKNVKYFNRDNIGKESMNHTLNPNSKIEEVLTKSLCKKIEEMYKENDYSETVET
ncbi:PREDICTED: uncharacterized protein LOC106105896 [Papilio polytes]|uniref:uncharacterized protein LOC106105896 n=1 Tax=Papilio polytes TaxID=76194 RepID=UPI0006768E6A|nr:PREDICTED: uncharacterized protein LOC106105896 [Papilio polytes]